MRTTGSFNSHHSSHLIWTEV